MRWLIPSGVSRSTLLPKRLFELHQDVNVAGLLLLAADKGTEETNAADDEAFLYLPLMAAKDINGFQGDTSYWILSADFAWSSGQRWTCSSSASSISYPKT
jgi:hypothetical protein